MTDGQSFDLSIADLSTADSPGEVQDFLSGWALLDNARFGPRQGTSLEALLPEIDSRSASDWGSPDDRSLTRCRPVAELAQPG